jgi:hypothetical protein
MLKSIYFSRLHQTIQIRCDSFEEKGDYNCEPDQGKNYRRNGDDQRPLEIFPGFLDGNIYFLDSLTDSLNFRVCFWVHIFLLLLGRKLRNATG